MVSSIRSASLVRLAVITLVAVASPSLTTGQHEHAAGAPAVGNIKPDAGRKWSTDAPLQAGMAAIRAAFDADHPAIHAGKETDEQYEALAARIESQVNAIVANCRLPADADENLHYVRADLASGVNLMRGRDPARTRHDGAARVHGALLAYGKYFDDPAWAVEAASEH